MSKLFGITTVPAEQNSIFVRTASREIKSLIRGYYKYISNVAIEEFIKYEDYGDLMAEALLSQHLYASREVHKKAKDISTSYVIKTQRLAEKNFNKVLRKIGEPTLNTTTLDLTAQNLITQQVQKITTLIDWQQNKISDVVQEVVALKKPRTYLRQQLNEVGIYNSKEVDRIIKNQLNFGTTVMYNDIATNLKLKNAVWRHKPASAYKTHGRIDHIEADGRIYKIEQGCLIGGEYIQPGQLPNCLCFMEYVIE